MSVYVIIFFHGNSTYRKMEHNSRCFSSIRIEVASKFVSYVMTYRLFILFIIELYTLLIKYK